MSAVTVAPLYDGDPVEGNTPDRIGVRLTAHVPPAEVDGAGIAVELDLLAPHDSELWGRLGDILHTPAPPG